MRVAGTGKQNSKNNLQPWMCYFSGRTYYRFQCGLNHEPLNPELSSGYSFFSRLFSMALIHWGG